MKPMPAAQSRFNRQHLPQPADYFKNQGVAFKGGW